MTGRLEIKCPQCGNEDKSTLEVIDTEPCRLKIHCDVCSKDTWIDRQHE